MTRPALRIALVTMPFAELAAPSIALLQLKTVLEHRFGDAVRVEIHYLNHDAALFLGDLPLYKHIMSNVGYATGVGDWFFRPTVFPDTEDNADEYLSMYYPSNDEISFSIRRAIQDKRPRLDTFLDAMIEKYDLASADIAGFTSIFSQTTASVAMAAKLKGINPGIITLMGGPACTGQMGREFSERFESIDYVFSGPGLVSLPRLVENHLQDNRTACEDINGVFSKTNAPRFSEGDVDAVLGEDLDINENLLLDYHPFLDAIETAFPDGQVQPRLLFETSRGCSWGERATCRFCGLNGPSACFRPMTPDKALAQIRSVLEYEDRCDFFAGIDNSLPREYLTDVLPHVHLSPPHKIQYEIRADLDDREIDTLCKAGVTLVQPGIESLSTTTLKLMRKGITSFSNLRFLKSCARHPVSMVWSLLLFSPGEEESTYEKYLDDFPRLTHLHPPHAVYPVEFVRYAQYFEHPEDYGLDLRPEPFYSLIYPYAEEVIARLACKFVDANADTARMEYWLDVLNEKVRFWRSRWLNTDNRTQSRLCLLEDRGETTVFDSRSGEEMEYPLSASAETVLRALEEPLTVDEITQRMAERPGIDTADEIGFLNERGLLFEDDNRYLNLVIL